MTRLKLKIAAFAAGTSVTLAAAVGATTPALAPAPASGTARVVDIVPGIDWSLPAHVKLSPYSGYMTWGWKWAHKQAKLPRYQDGNIHFCGFTGLRWGEVNPAEGVYDWTRIDKVVEEITSVPGVGFGFYVQCAAKIHHRQKVPVVPEWLAKKGTVTFLSNTSVAPWDRGSEYQKYLGRMIEELGARYKDHPKLIGVYMGGLDYRAGEWCWRDAPESVKEAFETTTLTPETFGAWGLQFIDDYVKAFKGQEHKLAWPGGYDHITFGRAFRPAKRKLWQTAYAKGCGGRDGMVEAWNGYLNDGHGMRLTDAGYLEVIEDFAPIREGRIWYTENENYPRAFTSTNGWGVGFGPSTYAPMRWFVSNMRALQMRRNWLLIGSRATFPLLARDPEFTRWVELSIGKNATTSADAWSWLREGYRKQKPGTIKNFERWLLQRDVEPDGKTVTAAKVDLSWWGKHASWYVGKDHEFHARRTDLANGSRYIYFRADREFLKRGPHRLLVKVTYRDGAPTEWRLEYAGAAGKARSEPITTQDTGEWQTVTLSVPDMQFSGTFADKMDFRLAVSGDRDLTVKMVRVVKP